ncbi:hypothetical protein HJC23_013112 [Cyclotella cryptica]|uniref:Uncharacterized protein n=1 Tax=Cyclotella cryptica TaxID=29204 RepID=A0ABD3QNE4_9STRA
MMQQQQFSTTMLMVMQGKMQNNMPEQGNVPPPHIPPMRLAEAEGKEEERKTGEM